MSATSETKLAIATSEPCDTSADPESSILANTELPVVDAGVQDIEAVTVAWTTAALIFAYVMIWLVYFVEGMLAATSSSLLPYVTSAFAQMPLTPTVSIISSVVGGVTNLTLAKILDVFGRPQGFLFCVLIATVGLAMMAGCNGVEAYAAAQVFFTVGNNGLQYSLSVFVADTSQLRNRGLMQALVNSPNLITCWLAGPISQGFLDGPGWRWAYGMFTIMIPCVTLPLAGLLLSNFFKARKLGLTQRTDHGRTIIQSLLYYCEQFDAIGLLLLSAGTALFLLPFNLYTIQARGWNSPLVISMLVIGIVLILAFIIWEARFARKTFIPYTLLKDRTVLGACILSAVLFISYFCWFSYFSAFLQVVSGLSVANATYVVQIYTVCSVICGILVGALIRYTGRFKPICLYFGIPLSIFGLGLMIYFSNPDGKIGYLVMCQIFVSVAAGVIIIADEIAILSAASHQHTAVCLAVLGLFGNIGGAIGLTVSSAIWQSVFPVKLMQYLPEDALADFELIYGDITTQLSYPVGSDTRAAIQHAYSDAQKSMLIAGTAVWVVGAIGVLVWRDIDVRGLRQNKGHVW